VSSLHAGGTFARPGYAEAFAIGLKPLDDPTRWLAPDDRLIANLAEKDALIASRPADVFAARADTIGAQAEALALLGGHLPAAFPQTYRRTAHAIGIGERSVPVAPDADPAPLLTASRLVADDLVLMRRHDDGWRLVAASLCFPSYWRLAEKFDRPLASIHAPVPGFSAGTRKAALIERMFDNLRPGVIVARSNWSLHDNGGLFRPQPHPHDLLPAEASVDDLAAMFLRCEDQTLRKLPESGDILFTIRVATDPLAGIFDHAGLAASLATRLRALDRPGQDYKGIRAGRDALADWLERGAARNH
jgi:hypothetical protein